MNLQNARLDRPELREAVKEAIDLLLKKNNCGYYERDMDDTVDAILAPNTFSVRRKECRECWQTLAERLNAISDDKQLLEVGRKAIEDTLIKFRDARLSLFTRGNGLVVRERDGRDSSVIRIGAEDALRIGLKAIAKEVSDEL